MERKHASNVVDLHTTHRIEYQQLVDDSLIYQRKLQTHEIELNDAKARLENEVKQVENIKQANQREKVGIHFVCKRRPVLNEFCIRRMPLIKYH